MFANFYLLVNKSNYPKNPIRGGTAALRLQPKIKFQNFRQAM